MSATPKTCAHITNGGVCVFGTRNWSPAITPPPSRCEGCPGEGRAVTLTEPYVARAIHYPGADVLEYVSGDVPTIARPVQAAVDILLDLHTREPIGWRIYGWSKVAPPAENGADDGEAVGPSPLTEAPAELTLSRLLAERRELEKELAEAREESRELTKALTGLTCNGSEFFVRKGDRYIADIPACVGWVRKTKTAAHERTVEAIFARQAAEGRALKAEAERREMLEALKPFADEFGDDIPREDGMRLYGNLRLGDFRKARKVRAAILSALPDGKGE